MRNSEDFICLLSYQIELVKFVCFTHEMCDQILRHKKLYCYLQTTETKCVTFFEAFLVKDKFKQHLMNRC